MTFIDRETEEEILFLAAAAGTIPYKSWVFCKIMNWHIMPLLGLKDISFFQAFLILLLLVELRITRAPEGKEDKWSACGAVITNSTILLAIGWIGHLA